MSRVFLYIIFLAFTITGIKGQSISEQIQLIFNDFSRHHAINEFHQLARLAKARNAFDTLADINLAIASIYFDEAISFDSAIYYCDQALSVIHENTSDFNIPYLEAWYKKGFYYRKWDKFEKSREALQVVLDEPENPLSFKATWQMGKLYKDRGEFSLAFDYYQKALVLAGDDPKKKINIYEYISFAYIIMGTDESARQAIYWLEKLEHEVKQLPDSSYDDYLPLAAYNKGECFYQLGELDKAEELVSEAKQLILACCNDNDFLGLIADFAGYLAYERGDYVLAIEKYREGIELFQYSYDLGRGQGLAGSYYAMAEAFLAMEKLDSALFYIDKTIIDRVYGFDNNLNQYSFPSLDDMLTNGEKSYLMDDLMLKGKILETINHSNNPSSERAILYYQYAEQVLDAMSYEHLDEQTKIFWREHAKDVYFELIRLFVENRDNTNAFVYAEKSKYVILEEHLRKLNFANLPSSNNLVVAYQKLLDTVKSVEIQRDNAWLHNDYSNTALDKLIELRKREDELLVNIKSEYPSLLNTLFGWDEPDVETIKSSLKKRHTLLIEYFVHDSGSYAFYLTEHGVDVIPLPPRQIIARNVRQFLTWFDEDNLSEQNSNAFQQKAFELFNMFIDSNQLDGYHKLVVVPDDVLSLIPFDVLVDQINEETSDYSALQYLVKKISIRYLLNAKQLYKQPTGHSQLEEEVISFIPQFRGKENQSLTLRNQLSQGNLMPLSGAIKEKEKLCELFRCNSFETNVTENLFYENVCQGTAILHIATHTEMNDSMPQYSALLMEQESSTLSPLNDNKIHVFELKNKEVPSDLVVLSACKTGIGKVYRGEGIASLGVAFQYAGSPNMVTSLWSIPDQPSALIMRDFYKNLKIGMPKFEALRLAKLGFLKNYPSAVKHPFHWSGLLYYGNELPLTGSNKTVDLIWLFLVGVIVLSMIVALVKYKLANKF